MRNLLVVLVLLSLVTFCIPTPVVSADEPAKAEINSKASGRVEAAGTVLEEIQNAPDQRIPEEVLGSAECVAVVPSLLNGGFVFGGRLDVKGITLKNLIAIAWNITSDDLLAGAPKWLDTDKFDIVAKGPATGPPSGPNAGPPVDIDSLRLMVRAMLVDRFKLATHTEDRPVSLYALVVAKSKLKKADESNRAGCKMGNAFGTNGSAPTFTYTCQNTP